MVPKTESVSRLFGLSNDYKEKLTKFFGEFEPKGLNTFW
jgi:hypothetical protein